MAQRTTGSVRWRGDHWSTRITVDQGVRRSFRLETCREHQRAKAEERSELLAQMAKRLRRAGYAELTPRFLERAAARDGRQLEDVVGAVEKLCAGEAAAPIDARITFRMFAEQWTSGELHRRWPDHVRFKKTAATDAGRLELHVYPHVGDVPLCEFSLEHADQVMSQLPARLEAPSRRHVAQLINRVMKLAAYPARLIPASPIPPGFLPPVGQRKAATFLYPDEDRRLLSAAAVPLAHRVLYGVLAREGLRRSDAAQLTWSDLDLQRGMLVLDKNKTDDPRAWAMTPGTTRALAAWWRLCGEPAPDTLVFLDGGGESTARRGDDKECPRLREHLKAAKVTRAELFEKSAARMRFRMHDLRATFVTVALANGRTETWVADRTGHGSSAMINRYRRAARQLSELELGDLAPLDEAIPELAAQKLPAPAKVASPSESCQAVETARETDQGPSETEAITAPEGAVMQENQGDGSWRTRTSSQWIKSPQQDPQPVGSSAVLGGEEGPNATDGDAPVHISAASDPLAEPLRARAIRLLGDLAGELGAAGDVHAARVLHEAFGRLIDAEEPQTRPGADVVDLAAHRRDRR